MIDSHPPLAHLKRQIEALSPSLGDGHRGRVSLGLSALDARLGGGIAKGAVHEVLPCTTEDGASAAAFALMLAARISGPVGKILWIATDAQLRRGGQPYGPGLRGLGLDPDQLILVTAPDDLACLKAASDSLACAGLAAVIIEAGETKRLDLTASRRLALAAERSGVTALLLRPGESVIASAAASRWQVASAPSVRLPGQAPGHPMLLLSLVRHRGGARPFDMMVEWNNDDRTFCEPTLLRGVSSPVERRQLAA